MDTATITAIAVTFKVPAISGSIPNNCSVFAKGYHSVPNKKSVYLYFFKKYDRFNN